LPFEVNGTAKAVVGVEALRVVELVDVRADVALNVGGGVPSRVEPVRTASTKKLSATALSAVALAAHAGVMPWAARRGCASQA
jgi:hypothetical protein